MSGLDQFEAVINRFGKLAGFAIGGSALVPLVTAASGLAPTWPTGLPFLASLLMLLTLAATFHFLTVDNRRIFSIAFAIGGLIFVASMSTHLYLFNTFTDVPVRGEGQIFLGCEWKPDTLAYARATGIETGDQCPGDYRPLLKAADGDPGEVFTPRSVRQVAFAMAASWLTLFVSLAFVLGGFAIWYVDKPARGAARKAARRAAGHKGARERVS